jgi:hypothetical protein
LAIWTCVWNRLVRYDIVIIIIIIISCLHRQGWELTYLQSPLRYLVSQHQAPRILYIEQTYCYSPQNAFHIFSQQIY